MSEEDWFEKNNIKNVYVEMSLIIVHNVNSLDTNCFL